jgi:purine-binding chemotaxis protein CheW
MCLDYLELHKEGGNAMMEQGFTELEDTQKDKYLTFVLGQEEYGLEIRYVTEIIGIQAITPVPENPDYIRGIINLRGTIIPVLDVRLRFRKEPREYNDRTCIIVVHVGSSTIGLIVDGVSEVLIIPDSQIVSPPAFQQAQSSKYISGIAKTMSGVKLLLDCQLLLSAHEWEQTDALTYEANQL